MEVPGHKPDCLCPRCKGARGESLVHLTIRLPKHQITFLRDAAQNEKTTMSNLVAFAIEQFMAAVKPPIK